jgi:transcriptional regulator with PAS, ATPase and Fis domain
MNLTHEVNALRMENMMLEQILTASEESFFIVNEKGKVLHISYSAAYKLGIEANDILGEQLQDILPIQFQSERKILVEDDLGKLHEINFGKKLTTNIFIGGTVEKASLRAFLALHQEQAFFVIFMEMNPLPIPAIR